MSSAPPDLHQEPSPEGTVRAEGLLRAFDAAFLRLDRAVHRVLPPAYNPLTQTGALANLSLVVAVVSGIVLLWWYVPSVHRAYDSVSAMGDAPITAGLLRSLHRYSSDVAMFLVLLHAAKLFFARRFSGARWLAWVTGVAGVVILWSLGWSGYWLVWDEPARQVALGTARMLDVLPLFADPLSRSFVSDAHLSSLLFFVVFFAHMLVPMVLLVALWLHVARLRRPHLFPRRPVTLWALGAMVALSLLLPADQGEPARMAVAPGGFAIDAWFLLPIALTDRLGPGALWSLVLLGGPVLFAAPWWLARPRAHPAPAIVNPSRCNSCRQCFEDCPYDAISMVAGAASEGGPKGPTGNGSREVALVEPAKCVACGICAGSCNSSAIGLPWFEALTERKQLDASLDARPAGVAWVCAESAGRALEVAEDGSSPDLPGWSVRVIPCAGWLHAATVERALKHGAKGALVVACEPGDCRNREGGGWTALRMVGEREPAVRQERRERVRVVHLGAPAKQALIDEARAFAEGCPPSPLPARSAVPALAAALLLSLGTWALSRLPYVGPAPTSPELVVSFKHPGAAAERCRTRTDEELAALPVHMRTPLDCERERASVRLRVRVDSEVVHEQAYLPGGLWRDGNSVAVARIPVPAGERRVEVALGERGEGWDFVEARELSFELGRSRVVVFGKVEGFGWE